MSGHNKWSQIKEKKAKTDAKKSQLFGKHARLIAEEARKAKGNRGAPGLRGAIEKARADNMPSENIERAVKKAAEAGGAALEAITYECYGPGGAAIIIEALTDSRNRTAQEIKHLLSEQGFALAAPGSALWAFQKTAEGFKPSSATKLSDGDLNKLATLVEALENHGDTQEVITNAE
ncbi:MAG: hypothetical protein UX94_C0008G0013 [Parcubacteria group bacterium GW2011_GWA2_47_21]|nr:MAG: hypothetical protein UX94_C0008G0013 [Parcubacteria group bacterium GW2011_GWA2_47_21]